MSRSAAAAVAGALWLGTTARLPWWAALAAGAGLVVAGARPRWRTAAPAAPQASAARLAIVLVAAWTAGAGLSGARVVMRDLGPLHHLRPGTPLEAVVVDEPRGTAYGSWTVVRVERMADRRVRQRALLRLGTPPAIGARLRLRARVTALPDGGFGSYLRSRGVGVQVEPIGQPVSEREPSWGLRATSRVRDRLRAAAAEGLPPDRAGLLTGIVTGDGRDRPDAVDDLLTAAGLRHLVVVSGRHTALFLAGIVGLAALVRLPFRGVRIVALVSLAWFVVLVRWQPSVLRAGAVAAVVLVADLLGRDRDHVHLLALAVVVLLLVDPLLGRQLGFVLSVAATAGVLVVAPAVRSRLRGPGWWRTGLATALAAQAAVAPVLVARAETVPLGGVVANLVAAPAAAAAQVVGTCAALLAVLVPTAAAPVAGLASWPLAIVLWAARLGARLPDLGTVGARAEIWTAAAVVVGALAIARRRRGRERRLVLVGAALGAVLVLRLGGPPPVTTLTVTALDVGQGDAVLVEAPDGGGGTVRLLVDGGPEDARVADRLLRRRIRSLDAVVLTHGHADHGGGLPAVLQRLRVGMVGIAPAVGGGSPDAGTARVVAVARGRDIPVRPLAEGTTLQLGSAVATVLSPPATAGAWTGNDRSVVMRVDGLRGSVLLTGDIEAAAQRHLLRAPARLRVDVLKVPHHGGATNAEGFLAATGAEVAVVSAGRDNSFGHPHPEVLADLRGMRVLRTDQTGDVVVPVAGPSSPPPPSPPPPSPPPSSPPLSPQGDARRR